MKSPIRILVVDDDSLSRLTTARQLEGSGYQAQAMESPAQALQSLRETQWHVILTDLRMPDMSGLEFLRRVKQDYPRTDVILMTAFATVETAVEAMKAGAVDYLVKPFRYEELELRLAKICELIEARSELETLRALLGNTAGSCGLVGSSPKIVGVTERIQAFSDHDAPVLVTGETGTGKEVVSRALHQGGRRRDRPFVPIGCGAIPPDIAESELFGHEKGAFTGALRRREGCFERANGGTVLLDDIDDLPPDIQVKLLRVLQEGRLTRVGGTSEIRIDVRIIATSKVDLEERVTEGLFRDDLFYRLRGLEIQVPPLRERGDDVLVLTQHFLGIIANREKKPVKSLTAEAAHVLRAHPWPGNVRELRQAVESICVLCRGEEILPSHLPGFLARAARSPAPTGELFNLRLDGVQAIEFNAAVGNFEQSLIRWALERAGGQQTQAADLLGMPRTTLQSKIRTKP